MSAIRSYLEDLDYDRERPITEVLADLQKLDDDDDGDSLSPVVLALLLRRPMGERGRVLDLLAKNDRLGGTYLEALPVVARTLRPDWLAQALELSGVKPGTPTGPDKRSLLHMVCDSIGTNEWTDSRYDEDGECKNVFDTSSSVNWLVSAKGVEERVLPTLALLLERGERADAKDKRGKTPLDLARRGRKEFSAQDWKRIEAALGNKVEAPSPVEAKTLEDYFHDPAFALGVLNALMRDGVIKRSALRKTLNAIADALEDDDESAREAVAVQALQRTNVTPEQLAAVATLTFDVDEPIYLWLADTIGADLGGESATLAVGSLSGLHHLTGLVALDLRHGYASGAKLDPVIEHLAELRRLRRLGVDPKGVSKTLVRALTEQGVVIADAPLKDAARKAPASAGKAAKEKTPAKKASPAKKGPRRFELVAGTSNKFWEIELRARKVVTRYGRMGSEGQLTEKPFDTAEEAKREHARLIAEKKKKGYVET